MARQPKVTQSAEVSKASNLYDGEIQRWKMGEVGYVGSPVFNGVSNAEIKSELNHPNSVKTYKLMSYHPAINAPLNLYSNMVAKATYRFVPPNGATEEEKRQTEIVEQMFGDMDHPLSDFIEAAMTMTTHGWSVVEKVWRKRTPAAGSMYSDGLIAPKRLPLRSQESIPRFIFSEDGNDVKAVVQNISGLNDPYNQFTNRKNLVENIPRSKVLMFSVGRNRSNPYGTSPLCDVYVPWKYLQAIEELEAQSITKDINGLPVLRIPAQYMSADASTEQKAIYENFKNMMRNLQQGAQSSMILPSTTDPESRSQLFQIELLSQDGKRNFDLTEVKDYYRTMIFIGMGADILLMGNTSTGSFAMGTLKSSLTGNVAESYITRILQVINDDLIKDIYTLNGWNPARRCKMDYEDMNTESLDEVGKFVQRVSSVNMLAKDIDTINYLRNSMGVDPLPEDADLEELLPDNKTRAAEAMGSPFEGTRTGTGDGNNSSDLNSSNAA